MSADSLAFFSQDDFGCFDFEDLAVLDEAQRQAIVGRMDQVFGYFFKAIGYQHIVRPKDAALRADLWAWGYSRLAKATPDNDSLDSLLDTAASCVETYYPRACHQSRIAIGTTTAAILLTDDLVLKPGGIEQFNHFSQRYLRGLPQPEGLHAALADGIKHCDEFYGSKNPRTGTFAVMGWLAGVDTFCEEARFAQELPGQFANNGSKDRRTEWSVEKLPHYIRNLGGVPNSYIVPIFKPSHDVEVPVDLWISAIPDLSDFILLGNDLLTFPKELIALENFNYLSLITRARRQAGRTSRFDPHDGAWTFRDSLYELFDRVLSSIAALDKLFFTFAESLSEDVRAAQTQAEMNGPTKETDKKLKMHEEKLENARMAATLWGEFRQGYIAWYINDPRYRLDSIRATVDGTSENKQMAAAG